MPLSGLLLMDKPLGLTSMDVCRRVRRRLVAGGAPKRVKVGHGGTLDPLATGVLVILVGRATKLCDQVMAGAKRYEATVDLSAFTTTDDAEGEREEVAVGAPPTLERVREACAGFVGTILQTPPAFSAMKVDGERAYRLARRGEEVRLAARPVRIDAVEVRAYVWPRVEVVIDCGKGTYIRSLARDLGRALGTGGTLAGLRRTRVGRVTIERCRGMEGLPERMGAGDLESVEAVLGSEAGA